MKTARRIGNWGYKQERMAGVYELSSPVKIKKIRLAQGDTPLATSFVVSSQAMVSGHQETLVFACNKDGGVYNFMDIAGVDILSHKEALADLGYTLVEENEK